LRPLRQQAVQSKDTTMTLDLTRTSGPDLPAPELSRILQRLSRIPSLREKYAGLLDDRASATPAELPELPELPDLPELTKDEFSEALAELVRLDPAARSGAYYFASGGTMSAPRLSLIPDEMFVPDILSVWRPLAADDILVNLFTPGRLWSAHYFYNALAAGSGAAVVPFGTLQDEEADEWLDFFAAQGMTALAATVKQILRHCNATGRGLPGLRKLLWVGESFDADTLAMVRDLLPDVELWGLYGSTETWVIGWNGPGCATDTFHPLPYQHLEFSGESILVTNSHPRCINPLLRYRVGDLGGPAACGCGAPGAALRVAGRADSHFKFLNQLVSPEEIVGLAGELPDVRDAQLVLRGCGTESESLELRVRPTPAAGPMLRDRVRRHVLAKHLELGYVLSATPAKLTVMIVDRLEANARTAKTPTLIVDPVG
jgi:phenylacetate-coenzyme A ligase PaaK-like adenylate-forming protein